MNFRVQVKGRGPDDTDPILCDDHVISYMESLLSHGDGLVTKACDKDCIMCSGVDNINTVLGE